MLGIYTGTSFPSLAPFEDATQVENNASDNDAEHKAYNTETYGYT